jgi:hypothetical protein
MKERTNDDNPSISAESSNSDTHGVGSSVERLEEVIIPQNPVKPPIVQVYTKRTAHHETCLALALSSSDPPSRDLDFPTSLFKGIRKCTLPKYPIVNFISYDHLSSSSSSLIASLDSISIPKRVREALSHPGWNNAMLEEIQALDDNHTWDLVCLPAGKKAVGCK